MTKYDVPRLKIEWLHGEAVQWNELMSFQWPSYDITMENKQIMVLSAAQDDWQASALSI